MQKFIGEILRGRPNRLGFNERARILGGMPSRRLSGESTSQKGGFWARQNPPFWEWIIQKTCPPKLNAMHFSVGGFGR